MVTYGVKLQRSDDLRLDSHPDGCAEDTFAQWCRDRLAQGHRLAVDLFSGAGGLSLGIEDAGWKVAVSVDNDDKAIQTHRHNFSGLALARDLGDPAQRDQLVELLRDKQIDLLAGGPPCQPFSRAGLSKIRSLVEAGHREEHDHRRELWQAFLHVALAVRPRAVLMENVPDMGLGDDFAVIRSMMGAFEREGYYTQLRLVSASTYGVPQHRRRLILLARRDVEHFGWPNTQEPEPILRDAIGDLPSLDGTIGARTLPYSGRPNDSPFALAMRDGVPQDVVWDHMTRPVRDDDRRVFQKMDSTTVYGKLPPEDRRYSGETFDDKYKKLDWEALSRSITAHIAKDGYWYIHPDELRTLTVREAARIQTFPDRFRFVGTRSDAFRQIGNAVPPSLGRAAASVLRPVEDSGVMSGAAPVDSRWTRVRQALTTWAKDRRRRYWYALPARTVSPAVAAVAALLTARVVQIQGVARAMDTVRNKDRLTRRDLDKLVDELPTEAGRTAVERFCPLTGKRKIWADADQLADALAMKPNERRVFEMLCGRDVLLATQSTLRVAARLAGSRSAQVTRMSDGRVDLATVVGDGRDAPLRAGALRLLGATICRPTDPLCGVCPLRGLCPYDSEADSTPTLF